MTRLRIALLAFCVIGGVALGTLYTSQRIVAGAQDSATRAYLRAYLHLPIASSTVPIATLRNQYLRQRAIDAPFFDISDSDPIALAHATSELEQAEKDLLSVQNAVADREHIMLLYPISFLKALSAQEQARRAFVASGTETDAQAYIRALDKALIAAHTDITTELNAFDTIVGTSKIKLIGYGGLTDTRRTHESLAAALKGFDDIGAMHHAQNSCLEGAIEDCIVPPHRPAHAMAPTVYPSASALAHVRTVRTLTMSAYGLRAASTSIPVLLAASRCLASVKEPPAVVITDDRHTSALHYVGDLFYIPTETAGESSSAYMHNTLGLTYTIGNPFTFYICPDSGADTASALATLATASYARTHPLVAPAKRRTLLRHDIIAEKDARDYLVIARRATSTEQHDIIRLTRMFDNRNAGLVHLVGYIALTLTHDVAQVRNGAPFNLKPRNLFLTHTAFATLFQTYNPSFGSSDPVISYRDGLATSQIYAHNNSYFDLLHTQSPTRLRSMFNASVSFELRPPVAMPKKQEN